jgi:hypothetical protein
MRPFVPFVPFLGYSTFISTVPLTVLRSLGSPDQPFTESCRESHELGFVKRVKLKKNTRIMNPTPAVFQESGLIVKSRIFAVSVTTAVPER